MPPRQALRERPQALIFPPMANFLFRFDVQRPLWALPSRRFNFFKTKLSGLLWLLAQRASSRAERCAVLLILGGWCAFAFKAFFALMGEALPSNHSWIQIFFQVHGEFWVLPAISILFFALWFFYEFWQRAAPALASFEEASKSKSEASFAKAQALRERAELALDCPMGSKSCQNGAKRI